MRNYLIALIVVLNSFGLVSVAKGAVEISDGSVKALWHFNDDSVDASGNGYNGTDTSMTYASGKLSNSAVFNGSSGYISHSAVITPIGAKSIHFWIKTNTKTAVQVITNNNSLYSGESGIEVYLNATTGYLTWGLTYASIGQRYFSQSGTTDLSDNTWHMIDLTWDGTTGANKVLMYLDGTQVKNNTATGTESNTPTNNLMHGKANTGTALYLNGSLDEMAILNRVLTPTEITSLWNSGTGDSICVTAGCGTPSSTASSTASSSITLCTGTTCTMILEHSYLWIVTIVFALAGYIGYRTIT